MKGNISSRSMMMGRMTACGEKSEGLHQPMQLHQLWPSWELQGCSADLAPILMPHSLMPGAAIVILETTTCAMPFTAALCKEKWLLSLAAVHVSPFPCLLSLPEHSPWSAQAHCCPHQSLISHG